MSLNTPLGAITVTEEDGHLVSVDWGYGMMQDETPLLSEACDQIEAYFDRKLQRFDLPLKPFGTPFRQSVWLAMADIPYGETRTYGDLAQTIGTAARPIGGACRHNPLPILIPCHRVVGTAHGGLGHYSGPEGPDDLDSKRMLLRLEQAALVTG